jgi:ABC-type Fe3+ transport system permease subunit
MFASFTSGALLVITLAIVAILMLMHGAFVRVTREPWIDHQPYRSTTRMLIAAMCIGVEIACGAALVAILITVGERA